MKIRFGLGGLILACACYAGQTYAKEITDHYNIKRMTVDVGDGWEAVISMKTVFALDTIVGEPKIMCAGTWQFEYAINPNVGGGRFDSDNLPQSVIDDITLYNVDIAFDASSMGTVSNPDYHDGRGQIGARVQCDMGVFYKSGSDKPSFNVPASTSWDETFFFNTDGDFENISYFYFDEEKAKNHMRYLKEFGRKHTWEDRGSWVMNASVNLWPIRQHVAGIERARLVKQRDAKRRQIQAERDAAKARADEAAAAIANQGDMSEDVFDDFFADTDTRPKQADDTSTGTEYLDRQIEIVESTYREARSASLQFANNVGGKQQAMADVYCAPENGVGGLDKVGNYLTVYAKCMGKTKPLPRAYVLAKKATFGIKSDLGLNVTQYRNATSSAVLIGQHDEDLDQSFLLFPDGKILNMARLLGGNKDGDNFIELSGSHISERFAFGLHFEDRPVVELDKNGTVLRTVDINDIPESFPTRSRDFESVRYGLKDELIIYWQGWGDFVMGMGNAPTFRTVFDKSGKIISHINISHRNYLAEERGEKVVLDAWDYQVIWDQLKASQASQGRYVSIYGVDETSITLKQGAREKKVDLSGLDFCAMAGADCESDTRYGRGTNAESFHYRFNPVTGELLAVYDKGANSYYFASTNEDIEIYVLKPVY